MNATVTTCNESYGFYGTVKLDGRDPEAAWETAMNLIVENTGTDPEEVRAFLDSKFGRHFADEVHNEMHRGNDERTATERAVRTWKGYKVSARTRRGYGIPAGHDYLTGMIISCAIFEGDC